MPADVILVCDNGDRYLDTALCLLTDMGCRIVDAESGPDLIAEGAVPRGYAHVVIADMRLPGICGLIRARCADARRPGFKLLLLSGVGASAGREAFTKGVLLAKMRRALDQAEARARLRTPSD